MVVVLAILPFFSFAQQKQFQSIYWLRYQNQLIFSPKLYWNNEGDNRRFFNPDVQLQFIVHSRLHYKIKRWDLGGGLTFSWAYAQKPTAPISHPTQEIRPVAEVNYEMPLTGFKLMHRVRLDNRFFEEEKTESVFKNSIYVARFRYRLQATVPVITNEEKNKSVTLKIADEIMLNHRSNTFDQNRVYATVDFALSRYVTIETGYIYIYQQRFGRSDFFERHVLRFSLLHKIFFY